MNLKILMVTITLGAFPLCSIAGDDTLDAAIGGGLGGAVGAAVGNEVGGRDGAIIGGAIGGAAGAAIATDGDNHNHDRHDNHRSGDDYERYRTASHGKGNFCPPGQAKKGKC